MPTTLPLRVPEIGESIREVQIARWLKQEGQPVARDESLVEIESDKATVELPSPVAGVLTQIAKRDGETAEVGEVIGYLEEAAEAVKPRPVVAEFATAEPPAAASSPPVVEAASAAAIRPHPSPLPKGEGTIIESPLPVGEGTSVVSPLSEKDEPPVASPVTRHPSPVSGPTRPGSDTRPPSPATRREETKPMSPIRRRIAERLVEAQQTAAILTSFNEIDMSAVIDLRTKHRDAFQERHGVKLGFMSFFVKAVVDGLKLHPELNAEIRGSDIVYRNYCDIGVAVGGGKGLVVPVLRDAQRMGFAAIERAIADFAARARDNKLKLEELEGGTFTITNGGVYGSLLSTPILNPPQSGILGMHAIQERPVAREGQIVIRPMMYVALSYDHRLVDGREAVGFLMRIKELVEEPARMLLET